MTSALIPEKFELPFGWNAPPAEWEKVFPKTKFKVSFGLDSFTEVGYRCAGTRSAGWTYLFDGSYEFVQSSRSALLMPGHRIWLERGSYEQVKRSVEIPRYMNVWDLRDIFPESMWLELGLEPRR
jgi:hypothetical protein